MSNPNGPYPGRQLFVGLSAEGRPALAYLVTGRSPQSRERMAVATDDGIRIGPIGKQEYDPLRHYMGVKYDHLTGIAVVSNGIQTDAIFETYRLLFNTQHTPTVEYMKNIMDGAGAEPDSLHTPRIAGVVTSSVDDGRPVFIIGIVTEDAPASTFEINPEPGILVGVSTYQGNLETPRAFDTGSELPRLQFSKKTAEDLATHLFNISEATNQGEDIRVCAIGGIMPRDSDWVYHIINRHNAD